MAPLAGVAELVKGSRVTVVGSALRPLKSIEARRRLVFHRGSAGEGRTFASMSSKRLAQMQPPRDAKTRRHVPPVPRIANGNARPAQPRARLDGRWGSQNVDRRGSAKQVNTIKLGINLERLAKFGRANGYHDV